MAKRHRGIKSKKRTVRVLLAALAVLKEAMRLFGVLAAIGFFDWFSG